MHFDQSPLLIRLVCEPHKAVTPANAGDRIKHDLRALATHERPYELWLPIVPETEHGVAEHGHKIAVGRLGREITDKDRVFLGERRLRGRAGWRRRPARSRCRRRDCTGPFEIELLGRVGHRGCRCGHLCEHGGCVCGRGEGQEAVSWVIRLLRVNMEYNWWRGDIRWHLGLGEGHGRRPPSA